MGIFQRENYSAYNLAASRETETSYSYSKMHLAPLCLNLIEF